MECKPPVSEKKKSFQVTESEEEKEARLNNRREREREMKKLSSLIVR